MAEPELAGNQQPQPVGAATSSGIDIRDAPSASASVFLKTLQAVAPFSKRHSPTPAETNLPPPSPVRRRASLSEKPFDLERYVAQSESERGTVLYLAYGSNLCYKSFQGRRGIRPLAQINVVVPELRLSFDLPGFPYTEPCFATSSRRDTSGASLQGKGTSTGLTATATTPLLPQQQQQQQPSAERQRPPEYHKDRWKKGLVGVVYEVTPSDYAHIIASEGGGASYKDILVTCHPLEPGRDEVPAEPVTPPFKAHTLFTPRGDGGGDAAERPRDPYKRRVLSYAQPSARYLKLLTTGADQHSIPQEYKDYLAGIRPYTITTVRQRVGQAVIMVVWAPFILAGILLQKSFQNKEGRSPKWIAKLMGALFGAMWTSYDVVFKRVFGDGERTAYKDEKMPKGAGNRVSDEEQQTLLEKA